VEAHALEDAGARAHSAEDVRERFADIGEIAAEIAHELRNILQIISASAYVARAELGRGEARAAEPHVAKIERSARNAHSIVDDLMALARGDVAGPSGQDTVSFGDVLTSARLDLPAEAAEWRDAVEPGAARFRAHQGLLARALRVLYENAIQASYPRAPVVTTRARPDENGVIIEVSDDGPGVAPELAARIFDPLVTGRPGGTGLGLALARRIARAHGGSIALLPALVPPSAPAEVPATSGATFSIALPMSRPTDLSSPGG
jgi:signal transduction histidine kinase